MRHKPITTQRSATKGGAQGIDNGEKGEEGIENGEKGGENDTEEHCIEEVCEQRLANSEKSVDTYAEVRYIDKGENDQRGGGEKGEQGIGNSEKGGDTDTEEFCSETGEKGIDNGGKGGHDTLVAPDLDDGDGDHDSTGCRNKSGKNDGQDESLGVDSEKDFELNGEGGNGELEDGDDRSDVVYAKSCAEEACMCQRGSASFRNSTATGAIGAM